MLSLRFYHSFVRAATVSQETSWKCLRDLSERSRRLPRTGHLETHFPEHDQHRNAYKITGIMDSLDRVVGSLVGLACGDAVGTTSEFKERGSFPEVRGMVGGGVFRLKPGQWTDDTSLALCLAQSLIERSGHDPRDQLARYLKWSRQGKLSSNGACFDVGNTTIYSLDRFRASNQTRNFCGSTHPSNAGNGSLMRLAPAPMLLRRHPELAITVAGETSRTTHASETTVDACRYFAGLLVGAMDGAPKEKLLAKGGFVPTGLPDDFWSAMQPPLNAEVAEVVIEASHAEREPPGEEEGMSVQEGTIRNDGYVVRTLEAALWAFGRTSGFEEGCLLIANLGDDSDTVAAVFGQLAGAFYGLSGIPAEWRDKIALGGLIESMAEELFDMSNRVDPCPPPVPPPPPSVATPTQPSTETTAGIAGNEGENTAPSNLPPQDERVTRFLVGQEGSGDPGNTEEDEGGSVGGSGGERAGGAYWGGGVAAHYQQLEDGYIVIKRKFDTRSYDAMETFEEDVRTMLGQHQTSDTKTAVITASKDAGSGSDAVKAGPVSSSFEEPVTDEISAGNASTAEKRKGRLTAEFVARVARDRVMLERTIKAGLTTLYRRP
ncbi:unnamed protein product [Scytosiphon promiscuus]